MRKIPRNAGYSRIAFTVLLAGLIVLLAGGAAFAQTSWPVYASSGGNGSISPAGTVYVPDGAAASFTFIPDPGFTVYQVYVDGTAVAGSTPGFMLSGVHSEHSISVTFVPVSGAPYDAGVIVTGPDLYLFGGDFDRRRDARDYSHRGAQSRAEAHPAARGGEGGGHEGGGHGGKR
jgi:hypothetical protein